MIEKREGQGAEAPKDIQLSNDVQISKNNLTSKDLKAPKINNFFEKNKIPFVATLSALAVSIIIAIVLCLVIPKTTDNPSPEQGSSAQEYTEPINYTKVAQKAADINAALQNAEDLESAKEEYIPQYLEIIEDEDTSNDDKIFTAELLISTYLKGDNKDFLSSIILINDLLKNPELNNAQRIELLYQLEQTYYMASNTENRIDTIRQILAIETDPSYTKEYKQNIDNNYNAILKELEQ